MLALLLATALAAPCPAVDIAHWTADLREAEVSFAALDEAGFDRRMEAAAASLPCLDDMVSPSLAAEYHRLVGLRRYVRRDEDGAKLAFAAAHAVDPFGAMPSGLLPPGHEARTLADNAATTGASVKVLRPRQGRTWFDGQATSRRPSDRPTLVQVQVDGRIATSQYLGVGEPMPAYDARPGPTRWIVAGVGIAGLLGGGALYGLALDQKAQLLAPPSPETTRADVLALQSRNHRYVAASAGSAAVGTVLIGVAAFAW